MANPRNIIPFMRTYPFVVHRNGLSGLDADYQQIIPFIRKAEGGLSKAKTDTASKNPVPDGSGYHTNKGVTWTTLQSFQQKLGIKTTAELVKVFYAMPDNVWFTIFKTGYWDPIKGDQIKSQAFADILVDWAYAAGPGRAIQKTQQFFNLPVTYKMDDATLKAINSITNEADTIKKFADYKKNWYLTLPNQEANYKGWANRLDNLYATVKDKVSQAVQTAKNNPVPTLLGVAAVAATIVWVVRSSKKKENQLNQAA
jgi:lysozyme family protein